MIFKKVDAEMALAARSKARLIAAIQEISRPYELDELTRVMRELLSAWDLEAIRGILQDWIARGRPRAEMDDFLFSMLDSTVRDLDRVRRCRNACRKKHIEESAECELAEARALGRRLLPSPCVFTSVFGPGHSSERDEGNAPPPVLDETSSPAWLVERLVSTAARCRWLLEHWSAIRQFFETGVRWLAEDSFRMIALMGKRPRDVLESSEVVEVFLASHALDRRGKNPFMALRGEVSLDDVNALLRRLGPRVKPTPDPGDAQEARQTLIAIVDRAIADLTARAFDHEHRTNNDEARSAAERAFDTSPRGLKLERAECDQKKLIKRMIRTLKRYPRQRAFE
jgi:hypothetical protein